MPPKLDPATINTLARWFKIFGFKSEGIKFWLEKYSLTEKIPDLGDPERLGNFVLYQAYHISLYHSSTKNKY